MSNKLEDVLKAIQNCYRGEEDSSCKDCPYNENMEMCMLIDRLDIKV